jgi:hypothetical protein
VTITITIDPESGERSITAETGGMIPAVVHDSVIRMADQLTVLREVHRNVDVDVLFFSDVKYLDGGYAD